ncbi:MAG TPA: alpha/beta fold hydrolase [Acidimicrobiales bacterium]|nr:alpha/beta fold hydrolase [Acidimicrobiales bacterium]
MRTTSTAGRLARVLVAGLAGGAVTVGLTGAAEATALPGPSSATGAYPVGNFADGLATEFTDPGGMPPGVTNGPCHPSAAHPYPVVLVHGTFANENFSWQALAPMLANAGYCVFGLNYGATANTDGRAYAQDYVETSARQLGAFVTQVLAWTGASQVDMVGHSQGGMMPRYYIDFLGGARYVHTLVGLAPSNHGTTADGITTLAGFFGSSEYQFAGSFGCPACGEQIAGSPFMQNLNGHGDTVPGPNYVVIESRDDTVVTPYTSAFLSGPDVLNVTLQDQCATDATEHVGIIYDPVALQDVMAALADNTASVAPLPQPACSVGLPVVGGV